MADLGKDQSPPSILESDSPQAISSTELQIPFDAIFQSTLWALAQEATPTLEAFGTGDDRDDIARYGLCLVLEAAELINALPWKRWARNPPDMNQAKEEFADMLCFMGSIIALFRRLGVEPYELTQAYMDKSLANRERFAEHLKGLGH